MPELANFFISLSDHFMRSRMLEAIKNNPVRVYAVVAAAVALVAYYVPSLPAALVLALAAAILGVGGEVVRAQVTPTRKLDSEN